MTKSGKRTGLKKSPLTRGQMKKKGGMRPQESKMTVRAPAAINRSARQTGRNQMRYVESERIATVYGSELFKVQDEITCQPAFSTSFPWLSGHAKLYEKYKVHKLVYRYKNLRGTNAEGNILMSFDYDSMDSPPANATELTQSTVYADGAPWRIFEMKVKTDGRKLFTQAAPTPGGDPKTYNMGKLVVATEGCQAEQKVQGYIECDYDIEFFDKQNVNSGVPIPIGETLRIAQLCNEQPQTFVAPFGNSAMVLAADVNSIGLIEVPELKSWQLPAGNFKANITSMMDVGITDSFEFLINDQPTIPPIKLANDSGQLSPGKSWSDFGYFVAQAGDLLSYRLSSAVDDITVGPGGTKVFLEQFINAAS